MSPLACTLFALAALLAAAHGRCRTKHVGRKTTTVVNYETVYFQPPGVEVKLDKNYCPYPMKVVGEDITVCNNDPDGPAPDIDGPYYPPSWSYKALCDDYECPNGGTADTKQYCGY